MSRGLLLVKHRVAGVLGTQLSLGAPEVLVLSFKAFMSCHKLQYCLEFIQRDKGRAYIGESARALRVHNQGMGLSPAKSCALVGRRQHSGSPSGYGRRVSAVWRSPTKRGLSSRCNTSMALATPQPRPSCRRRCANSPRVSELCFPPGKDFLRAFSPSAWYFMTSVVTFFALRSETSGGY